VGVLAPGDAEPAVVTGPGVRAVLAVAAAAGIVTVIVAVTTSPGSRPPALPAGGILVDAEVNPQSAYFGDTLLERVTVLVDRRRIDPSSLSLRGSLAPYAAGAPAIDRHEVGHVTRMTYTQRLRCLARTCLPADPELGGRRTFVLPGIRVLFDRRDGTRGSLLLALPALETVSRLSRTDAALLEDFAVIPFRASPGLGTIDYAASPSLLAAAGWLVLRYGRRPKEPVPEPVPEPQVVLSPLERALLVLEQAQVRGSTPDERKALELLAGELGRTGDAELATTAKGLAWSAPGPTAAATLSLTAEVRSVIERSNGARPQ